MGPVAFLTTKISPPFVQLLSEAFALEHLEFAPALSGEITA